MPGKDLSIAARQELTDVLPALEERMAGTLPSRIFGEDRKQLLVVVLVDVARVLHC
ncbi:hypothetical protein D3C87_1490330 [compost metagenome]